MGKITIERETLQAALNALEAVDALIEHQFTGKRTAMTALQYVCDDAAVCVPDLRAALAVQPAEAQPTGQSPCARHCEAPAFEGEIRRLKREATIKDSLTIRPPAPAAVPLTDEQIDDICWNFNCSNTPLVEYDRLIARAIEAAHGIAAAGDKP